MLQHMVDTLFKSMELNSWTIHDPQFGITTCTLRFKKGGDHATGQDTNQTSGATSVHFKRKSASRLQRDRNRIQNFSRPFTRSPTSMDTENIETVRECREAEYLAPLIITPSS